MIFGDIDASRLAEIFGKRDANGDLIPNEYIDGYVPLTSAELTALAEIPVVVVGRDFFQNYAYAFDNGSPEKATEFYNPQTLKMNHWLHFWGCFSTSPYENCFVATQTAQGITSVTVSPATATISVGQSLQLSATVVTTGFANKAVAWSVDSTSAGDGVTINEEGVLKVSASTEVASITVTATSVYDSTVTGTATITVAENVTVGGGE